MIRAGNRIHAHPYAPTRMLDPMRMTRVALVVAALAVPAPAAAGPGVQIQTGPTFFETRPAGVTYTANLAREATHLEWTSWGGARAVASGIDIANPCKPTCDLDHARGHRARFVFSGVGRCGAHRVYTRVTVITARWAHAWGGTWRLPLSGCR
jgi:hypothetical protein